MATEPTVVFLDANVLARPVTRTLLLSARREGLVSFTWSRYVEAEADRHLPSRSVAIAEIRRRFDFALGSAGTGAERFAETSAKDRQVLADADAARAVFLVTSDVDDFAETDLATLRMTAVSPDLFMALRFSRDTYLRALHQLVANMKNPPRTAGEMHGLLSRQHPRLVAAHAGAFDVAIQRSPHPEPSTLVRGVRCLRCESAVEAPSDLTLGLCVDCRP
jgi:hypothetical protein